MTFCFVAANRTVSERTNCDEQALSRLVCRTASSEVEPLKKLNALLISDSRFRVKTVGSGANRREAICGLDMTIERQLEKLRQRHRDSAGVSE